LNTSARVTLEKKHAVRPLATAQGEEVALQPPAQLEKKKEKIPWEFAERKIPNRAPSKEHA